MERAKDIMATESATRTRQGAHPTPARYVAIALILAAITIVEVVIVYLGFLRPVLIPLLAVLSITKFAMVAMFFMHLKFDDRLFSVLFVGGLLLATGVLVALMTLLGVFFV
jgi:cytochrome c oxidase subunit 4